MYPEEKKILEQNANLLIIYHDNLSGVLYSYILDHKPLITSILGISVKKYLGTSFVSSLSYKQFPLLQ